MLFAEYIGDYALAVALGIVFQYFAIAPMRGLGLRDGLKAAAKADSGSGSGGLEPVTARVLTCSGKAPEVAGQAKLVEDRLVLPAGMRLPVACESIAPPCVRKFAQLRDRDRGSRIALAEPAVDESLPTGRDSSCFR